MMRHLRPRLVWLARRIARSQFAQSLLREIDRMGREDSVRSLPPLDEFVGSDGNRFRRFSGYRDLVVPRWPGHFKPQPDPPVVKESEIAGARERARSLERFLQIYGLSLVGADVLEAGCYGGAYSFALAELGAKHVDGIDIPEYGVREVPGREVCASTLERQSRWLQQLREATARLYDGDSVGRVSDRVAFFDLDVADLDRENAYDVIVSWQTLEHVIAPEGAITNMYRALRAGGVCFHEYNPFFCLDGGHSLCTLDFPYGHVRLPDGDFERYVRTYRPQELDAAMNFFRQSLNRMTLGELRHYCTTAGFEILAFMAWHCREDLQSVDRTILSQCSALYSTITIGDLLSRFVWILLRKPCLAS